MSIEAIIEDRINDLKQCLSKEMGADEFAAASASLALLYIFLSDIHRIAEALDVLARRGASTP